MKTITTIGIDLAKNSCSVYGVNAKGTPLLYRTLSRVGVVRFSTHLPACLVSAEWVIPTGWMKMRQPHVVEG